MASGGLLFGPVDQTLDPRPPPRIADAVLTGQGLK